MLKQVSLVIVVALAGCASNEKETTVTLDQVPAAVRATINKEAAGSKVTEIEKEVVDGKTVYEAEVAISGKDYELTIAEDGRLLGKELDD